ncbi:phage tail tape measure protein, partial [Paenibacillus motobuensis]|uniref:phage tail tape measure protein n=1 Tax=Paenibacillus motobuensis TaxID=295324 RepID=UPI003626FC89
GKIRPLGDIIGQLETSFTRLTQAQQADAAATIAGREAASGFLTLISQGQSTLDGYTSSLQNAGGTAEAVANTQMDTLNGAIIQMQSALEGVGITVGDMFAPAIRKVAETITEALTGFSQLNPALQAAIVALPVATIGVLGLAAGLGALAIAFKALEISFPILGAISLAIGAVVAGVAALVSWNNQAAESVKKHDEAQKSLNDTLNQSPLKRTVSELEELQQRTEDLNAVLKERAALQERLNEIEAFGEDGLGTPQLLSEALDINDELEKMDKLLREMGYDGVDDATEKLGEMKKAAEESTAALFEMRKEEINDLATKKRTLESVDSLIAKYTELNAKQELDAAQKRELISTVNALKREYPDLNAKMDEEGRIRVENISLVETQIQRDRDFLDQAVQTQKTYIQNLITTTEQQRKSVEAQIKNYTNLLNAMKVVSGASPSSPFKSGATEELKMANPLMGRYVDKLAEDKRKEIGQLYEDQNAFIEQERELKKALNSLTSGDFASDAISDPITLGKEKKEKKPKAKKEKKTKSAAELAAEARKKAYDADLATIRFQAEMFDWSTDKQIKAYERLRKTHERHLKDTVDDRRTLDLQVKRLNEDTVKSQFDFSAEWIKQEERRMELSGKSENEIVNMKLKAWTRVRDRYDADSEFYKRADDQVYQARKALMDKTVKLAEDSVKKQKSSIDSVKKAEIEAIKKRKEAALADYDARIKAIDDLIKKEAEYNGEIDYETELREKNARIDLLASAVGPEGIQEREDLIKERDRMVLEHERELRKKELESQKDALKDEKDAQADAFDREIDATEAQYDKLIDAFNSYSGDIKTIEAILAEFRVSEAAKANAAILSELDSFVAQYNAKMSQVETLRQADELAEYNSNKDAWAAAKARGDTAEMARLSARNQAIRDKYGIDKDTGKLQSFHGGGVVRGARGAETVVLAKAGEMVLTDRQQAVLFEALSGVSARPVAQPSGAITHNTYNIDMGADEVILEDRADIRTFYDERARVAERLQTMGVKP